MKNNSPEEECIQSEPHWMRKGGRGRQRIFPRLTCQFGRQGSSHIPGDLQLRDHRAEGRLQALPTFTLWDRPGSKSVFPGGEGMLMSCYWFFIYFYVSSSYLTFDYLINLCFFD